MTRKEGLARMDAIIKNLDVQYKQLEQLNATAKKPTSKEVQAKAGKIIAEAANVAIMGMNLIDWPDETKRPTVAMLYAMTDTFGNLER